MKRLTLFVTPLAGALGPLATRNDTSTMLGATTRRFVRNSRSGYLRTTLVLPCLSTDPLTFRRHIDTPAARSAYATRLESAPSPPSNLAPTRQPGSPSDLADLTQQRVDGAQDQVVREPAVG